MTPVDSRVDRSLVIVDGIDGSGKSVLAARLATAADLAIVSLAVDDFRRPVDFSRGDRAEAEIYYDEYYDLRLLDQCLDAFARGEPSFEIPIFDSAAHRLDGRRTIVFGAARVAIVEGVFSLRLQAASSVATVIYVQASFAAARQRIIDRDTARGRTRADVEHRIAARYFPAQERYLRAFQPSARADVLIDHENLGAPRVVRSNADRRGALGGDALSRALADFATTAPGT